MLESAAFSLPADYAQCLGRKEERWCGLPCWTSPAGTVVINALFTLKFSLLVLLNLDSPLVDCKFKVSVIPKPFHCKCSAVKMAPNWVPVCSICGSSPCAFTHCQTCKHLFCLWLSWGLMFFRERELMTAVLHQPPNREFACRFELWGLVSCWYSWRQGWSLTLISEESRLCWARDWLYSRLTLSIKIRLSPTNFLVTQDPCSQNSICSSYREQTALSLHSTLGEGRIHG